MEVISENIEMFALFKKIRSHPFRVVFLKCRLRETGSSRTILI